VNRPRFNHGIGWNRSACLAADAYSGRRFAFAQVRGRARWFELTFYGARWLRDHVDCE